jgi:hypothetical protein
MSSLQKAKEIDNLKELTKIIQEAVPEIVNIYTGTCRVEQNKPTAYSKVEPSCVQDDFGVTILGRDITLEDVLIAIKKTLQEDAWEYLMDPDGVFWRDWGEGRHECTCHEWKHNTPLHLQKQETIDFIHGLLVKK